MKETPKKEAPKQLEQPKQKGVLPQTGEDAKGLLVIFGVVLIVAVAVAHVYDKKQKNTKDKGDY